MPIYEFKCEACQIYFEELCSLGAANVKCPRCGSSETKRKISTFGIVGANTQSLSSSSGTKCSSCHSGHCHSCH